VERTLSSPGGSVRAVCTSAGLAHILSASATKPYKVERADQTPAAAPVAAFRHGVTTVVMTVTCSGGVPSASTTQV
jgi:serine/threonine-protein kinase